MVPRRVGPHQWDCACSGRLRAAHDPAYDESRAVAAMVRPAMSAVL